MYKFIAKVKKGTAIVSHTETDNADFLFEMSEENGVISIAQDGKLKRNYDYDSLRQELTQLMLEGDENARGFRQRLRMVRRKDDALKNEGGKDETV